MAVLQDEGRCQLRSLMEVGRDDEAVGRGQQRHGAGESGRESLTHVPTFNMPIPNKAKPRTSCMDPEGQRG